MLKKYFIYSILVIYLINILGVEARAEVCIKESNAVDIITLLNYSESELSSLSSCESLVKDIYNQLNERDSQVKILTKDLISAKQDVIKYKASAARWKKVAWYTTAAGVVVIILKVAAL